MSTAKITNISDLMKMNKEVNRFASMYDLIGYDDETEFEVRVGIEPDEETDDKIQALVWDECERHKLNPERIEVELLLVNKNETYVNIWDLQRCPCREYRIPFRMTQDELMQAVAAHLTNMTNALLSAFDLYSHPGYRGKKP